MTNQIVEQKCIRCGETFSVRLAQINFNLNHKLNWSVFCSQKCNGASRKQRLIVECKFCHVQFEKRLSQVRKSKNHFCNSSCAAQFNNRNKTKGARRSKLEIYIEKQIINEFPTLTYKTNCKDIGYELDFYFPNISLAVEINGIYHYKPIHGLDKLHRIQIIDNIKQRICHNRSIYLFVYKDLATNFTDTVGQECWEKIKELIIDRKPKSDFIF